MSEGHNYLFEISFLFEYHEETWCSFSLLLSQFEMSLLFSWLLSLDFSINFSFLWDLALMPMMVPELILWKGLNKRLLSLVTSQHVSHGQRMSNDISCKYIRRRFSFSLLKSFLPSFWIKKRKKTSDDSKINFFNPFFTCDNVYAVLHHPCIDDRFLKEFSGVSSISQHHLPVIMIF